VPTEPAIFLHPSRALAAAGGLLLVFAVLAAVVTNDHRLGVDDTWWRWMGDGRTTLLTDLSKVLNDLGDFVLQLVVRVAVAIVLAVRGWGRRLVAWAFVALLSTPICAMMKAMVDRQRPAGGLVHAGGASFPSGHALAAAVTAIGIVLALTVPGRARLVGAVFAGAYAVVMAWSRTELGVHWLTDVVAGSALGAALTIGTFAIVDQVATRGARSRVITSRSVGLR